ncbi:MAG: hypothetical protein ACUVV0_10105 [Anaerolineae bacterium]
MRFEKDWQKLRNGQGSLIYRPILFAYIQEDKAFHEYHFLVDSVADISMAPIHAFKRLNKVWEEGQEIVLRGISPKEECVVRGRIHEIDLIIPKPWIRVKIPVCFAEGNVPFVLGREYFSICSLSHWTRNNVKPCLNQGSCK